MKSSVVKDYFDREARDFDEIYGYIYGYSTSFINRVFRKGMKERFQLTIKECQPGKTLLDVGCGSGHVSLMLAQKGLKVTGIDFSETMIELANKYKKSIEAKKPIDVEFLRCEFLDFVSNNRFDITLALGVTDYLENPMKFLEKMKSLTREKMIVSFPARYAFQMPIRKVWLWTKGCPVYFYTKGMIRELFNSLNLFYYEIKKVSAGYLVVCYV